MIADTSLFDGLLTLQFPFTNAPDVVSVDRLILNVGSPRRIHLWTWCYLRRRTSGSHPKYWEIDKSSILLTRARELWTFVERLNEKVKITGWRSSSIESYLGDFGRFLTWCDDGANGIDSLNLLASNTSARAAIEKYNNFQKARISRGEIKLSTAAMLVESARVGLELMHGRTFADDIPLLKQKRKTNHTQVPEEARVAEFLSSITQFFDQTASSIIAGDKAPFSLEIIVGGHPHNFEIGEPGKELEVAVLAALSAAALTLADSGSNLAQLLSLNFESEIVEQIRRPDVSSARQRVVKFRAGGRYVPITLSLAAVQRLRTYLSLREWLLQGAEAQALFVTVSRGRTPIGIAQDFLSRLRRRMKSVGINLPNITAREWRAYKQNHVVRTQPLPIAAAVMGHSIETAVRAYSNGRKADRAREFGSFLDSLVQSVVDGSGGRSEAEIPIGGCSAFGEPQQALPGAPVEPNCRRQEGCLFCDKYRVHADEVDMRKLLSFRYAMKKLVPLQGSAEAVDRAYGLALDSVEKILIELRERNCETFERVEIEVDRENRLSPYWSAKVQQLAFLGLA
ncbi:hypothetical protein NYO99_16375 [Pelomonas sp. UHG3]|uniref:Uncharacterized protein n=1 Tax=Roseateles hydrophilus TaxID=2975054 RepID=A0ACC6CDT2_9BURK|nr:hypothetical protein [Pelomonas sp. UHG3]MCY4746560.1 hypothetical protein [Pelomonas sp. UHG3]